MCIKSEFTSKYEVAERTGLEPATTGVTGQYSKPTELPLRQRTILTIFRIRQEVVGVAGVEPATCGL